MGSSHSATQSMLEAPLTGDTTDGEFKIALFSAAPYDKEWFDRLNEELGLGYKIRYLSEMLTLETVPLAAGCKVVCTFVNDNASSDVIFALDRIGVTMIALRCAGFDRVDLEAAKAVNMTVARVPAYSPYAVSEHAVSLLLSIVRKIPQCYRNSRAGNFKLNGMLGVDLYGRRVGIIGTGLIGSITAKILKKGFECDVVAYDVFENPKVKNPEPEGLGIPYMDLDTLLSTCDFISLHAPLLPTTRHMISEDKLAIMKKGIVIINTSRGPLIDTRALIKGLKDGTIGAAGVDVVEGEGPYFFKNCSLDIVRDDNITTLLRMPNVIITAHQAFFTREALWTIAATTLQNVDGVKKGTGPPKQNGKLDTVCTPMAPSPSALTPSAFTPSAKSPTAVIPACDSSPNQHEEERARRMTLMGELPLPAPHFAEDALPRLNSTSEADFRVAFFSTLEHEKELFRKYCKESSMSIQLDFYTSHLSSDTVRLVNGADAVCIFVYDDCNADVLRALKAKGVKMVALRCAGYNNVDVEAAMSLGIPVTRVPAASPHAVAEHAAALATAVNRKIPQAVEATRRCDFSLNGLVGFDMIGKKVGIIGTGRIGCISARIFKNGFGCDVIATDIYENPKIKDAPPAGLGISYVSLDELCSTSDIILLHAPLVADTLHTIDMAAVQKMKKGVIIINTARGGLIDNKALIAGLKDGTIGGVGLDNVENEEEYFFSDWSNKVLGDDDVSRLLSFNNVVVTSHHGFFTMEAMHTTCHTTLANLNAARDGEEPPLQRGKFSTVVKA